MNNEIIVEVGAEGGSLTLLGQRNGRGWLYNMNLFDQTLSWVDDGPEVERTSKVVKTWAAALKLLDQYPWHRLYPLHVHPGFKEKVFAAVVSRNKRDHNEYGMDRWKDLCGAPEVDCESDVDRDSDVDAEPLNTGDA
jgi:hypothetical protein